MCWKEKIQWQCYARVSERAWCVTFFPPHFGQGKIIYANYLPWYIAVIVVSRSHVTNVWKWKSNGEMIGSEAKSWCNLDCPFLLPLRYSLTFILKKEYLYQELTSENEIHMKTRIYRKLSGDTKQSRLESTTEITQNKHVLLCRWY
jgi:hypothetical protein